MFKPASIIVTGASRGLGAAVARWLGARGAAVTLFSRDRTTLEPVARSVRELGGSPLIVEGDAADHRSCNRAVEAAVAAFGRLDGLVNNAGALEPVAALADTDPEQWRANVGVNLLGPYYMMRAAIPALRETAGRIVNISSGAATKAIRGWSAYCVTKAGLNRLTAVVAVEEPLITVTSLRPGVVDTDMQALIRREGPGVMDPDKVAYFETLKQDGRLEPPWLPARSAAWLALEAPNPWSGRFVEYDDPEVTQPAEKLLGPGPI